MLHPICRIRFENVADYLLRVRFDDGVEQRIDFLTVLAGELFGSLRDATLFGWEPVQAG